MEYNLSMRNILFALLALLLAHGTHSPASAGCSGYASGCCDTEECDYTFVSVTCDDAPSWACLYWECTYEDGGSFWTNSGQSCSNT